LLQLPVAGTPFFYLQVAFDSGAGFSQTLAAGGALVAPKLKAHKPYTFFGETSPGSLSTAFTPCYTIASTGKHGVEITGMGTLFKDEALLSENSVIEIYKGKMTTNRCEH
jgi:hypothetical protein